MLRVGTGVEHEVTLDGLVNEKKETKKQIKQLRKENENLHRMVKENKAKTVRVNESLGNEKTQQAGRAGVSGES